MKKKIFLFIIIFIILITSFAVLADETPEPRVLEVDYPKMSNLVPPTTVETPLLDYIKYLFSLSIIIIGIIVFISLLYGGFLYLVSTGNPTNIANAKDRISGAVIGLILILGSWLILNAINPQLIVFYSDELKLKIPNFYSFSGYGPVLFLDSCSDLKKKQVCQSNNECNEPEKCLDIFKDGNKICIDPNSTLQEFEIQALKEFWYVFLFGPNNYSLWDNRAKSIILYDNEVRICADNDFKECKIIKKEDNAPAQCFDIESELSKPIKLGDQKLSSFQTMEVPRGARLYEDKNFGGKWQNFYFDEPNICYNDLSEVGENSASSIEISPGYWTTLCEFSNGSCSKILRSDYPLEANGYGLPNLDDIDFDNLTSKICVSSYYECGGVFIGTNYISFEIDGITYYQCTGATDFIPKVTEFQLTKSLVGADTMSCISQYLGNCKVTIYEFTGNECATMDACCWDVKKRGDHGTWSYTFTQANEVVRLDQEGDFCNCPGQAGCTSCTCEAKKFTFPVEKTESDYCCDCCEACQEENWVDNAASCITVSR